MSQAPACAISPNAQSHVAAQLVLEMDKARVHRDGVQVLSLPAFLDDLPWGK